ncbi:hypothetical protein E2C01_023969 [Portunus trituberculatus]|uniref:Uncharacterized protein n=1 Tax=Portunus trituberculatus TaxID=210409 RepID=A0A5B7EBG4_PORTR|nr:hypothetical protein [Portunus trituberculatus]
MEYHHRQWESDLWQAAWYAKVTAYQPLSANCQQSMANQVLLYCLELGYGTLGGGERGTAEMRSKEREERKGRRRQEVKEVDEEEDKEEVGRPSPEASASPF